MPVALSPLASAPASTYQTWCSVAWCPAWRALISRGAVNNIKLFFQW